MKGGAFQKKIRKKKKKEEKNKILLDNGVLVTYGR